MAFVQSYYGLLPGNTDAAWALLGPQAQAASGGRDGFERFYAGLQSVSLQNPQRTGDDTVSARVAFVPREGNPTNEAYSFVMTTDDQGNTIMQSFRKGG